MPRLWIATTPLLHILWTSWGQPIRLRSPRSGPRSDVHFALPGTADSTEALRAWAPPPWCLVEKSGWDFHRLAAPTCPKSAIQSIPKYGSGAVRL